ncbi:MAG: glycosyltransferase family 39 protein, partial [Verrucomicrobiota bacterium]
TLLTILFVTGLLCRLSFVFLTPTFYAPDEESHYKYIQHLVEQRSFPIQTSKLGEYTNDFEYNQPPLYYLLLTPLFWLGHAVFGEVSATVILLRLVSVLFWGANVWLVKIWLRRLEINNPFVWTFVMGMVCLLPTYVFVSSVVNNDNLLTTLGGALLCLLARREASLKNSLTTGLVLGLALLTKQSAGIFVPAIVLLALGDGLQKRTSWATAITRIAIVGSVSAMLFLPRAFWNFKTYGSLTPEFLILSPIPWPSFLHGIAAAAHNILKTFWAVAGITNNIAYPFPLVGMALMGLCLLAQQEGIRAHSPTDHSKSGISSIMVWALALTVIINIGLVLRFGYISGMGQGRHLFPVVFPLALALASGLRPLPIKSPAVQAVGFWVAYAVVFTAFSLKRFP